jgi:hypothetical protein
VLVLLAGLVTTSPTQARPPGGERAAAEALFREGRRLMKAGQVARACPKFAESQRLDPQLGTLINLALCHKAEGLTATAWSEFSEAATLATRAGHEPRASFCRKEAEQLEPKLARVRVDVAEQSRGLVVRLDGRLLEASSYGLPLPVDPGEIDIQASAPDRESWSTSLTASARHTSTVEVPVLSGAGHLGRTLGWIALGLGGAAMVTGGVTGGLAVADRSELDADPGCPDHCSDADLVDRYNSYRIVSGVGLIGGGVLVAAGIALWASDAAGTSGEATSTGLFVSDSAVGLRF